jgi:hypothetical protein
MAIQSKPRAPEGTRVTVSYSDSINLIKDQVRWSPKGVSLLTKWPFRVGAEVEFAFDHQGERHCCSGVVVGCHPLTEPLGFYETILFFVETPCSKLQKAACECQLAKEQELAARNGAIHDGVGAAGRSRSIHARR